MTGRILNAGEQHGGRGLNTYTSLDLDWRLLIPAPSGEKYDRLLVLGTDEAMRKELEDAGIAREVVVNSDGPRADVVACLGGAGLSLGQVGERLGPSSTLYYESEVARTVRGSTSPARLSSWLRARNLTPAGLYWVHPGFNGPRTYFPLDVQSAVRWYFRNLHGSTSQFAAVDRGLDLVSRLNPRLLGRFAPRLAVVATARSRKDLSPLPFPADELPSSLRTPDVRPLLLVHGTESTHAVMLPFNSASEEPLAVLKVRRGQDDAAAPGQAILSAVRAGVDGAMRATIPEPLGVLQSGGVTASVESFLPGQWLRARLARSRLRREEAIEDLDLAVDWIAELHERFPIRAKALSEEDVRAIAERPVDEFVRLLGTSTAEAELLAEFRRRAYALVGTPLPLVWQHGDFSSLNVLRSSRRIHVIDWEMASQGLPLEDVLHFARLWLYLARHADRPATFAAFGDLFLWPHHHEPLVDAARAAIARYLERLALEPRLLPVLLVAGCVRRAVARAEGRRFLRGQPSDPRERNRYVTYLALIAEHGAEVFWRADAWRPTR
jgi:aminoglycoside phosphotransferase (APT) family kinase protein